MEEDPAPPSPHVVWGATSLPSCNSRTSTARGLPGGAMGGFQVPQISSLHSGLFTLCSRDEPGQLLGAVSWLWYHVGRGTCHPASRSRGVSYLARSWHSGAGSTGVGFSLTNPGFWIRLGSPRCHGARSPGGGIGHYGRSPKTFIPALCPEEAAYGPDQEYETLQRAWCAHATLRTPTSQRCAEVPSCPPGGAAISEHHTSPHGQVCAAP